MTSTYDSWAAAQGMGGTYRTSAVKPFCPCDSGRPQDCQPEDWPGAHSEPPCLGCGGKRYAHLGALLLCPPPPGGHP